MTNAFEQYEAEISAARRRFARHPAVERLFDPALGADELEAFFIAYNALGVRMTEHVESWIERAGRSCIALGYSRLGAALVAHARHEAGHHLMMMEDTRTLVAKRNHRLGSALSADLLLQVEPSQGVRRYVDLHERSIESEHPYGQIAIEYEIEKLSVDFGGRVLERCSQALGARALDGLSFLREHVEVDVGHTKLNAAELGRFLREFPQTLETLVRAGGDALDAYAAFVSDCFALAQQLESPQPPAGAAVHAPLFAGPM